MSERPPFAVADRPPPGPDATPRPDRPPPAAVPRPTLDHLLADLPPTVRAALLPHPPPARRGPPRDPFAVPPAPFAPAPDVPAELAAPLACPDLFLVSAPPGDAREEYVSALVRTAAARGERVLVLAANSAAADRLAGRLDAARPGGPPDPAVTACRSALAAAADAAAAQVSRFAAAAACWDRLRQLAAAPTDGDNSARQAEVAELRERLKAVTPLADAKKGGKVLSGVFWKSLFAGDVAAQRADLEEKLRAAEAAAAGIDGRSAEFAKRCDELAAAGAAPPAAATPAAVAEAEAAFHALRRQAEDAHAVVRRLREAAAADACFLARAGVVLATPADLANTAVSVAPFGLLVVEAADRVAESDCRAAAALAGRWVFFGTAEAESHAGSNGKPYRNGTPAGPFARLWAERHRPAWAVEDGRLVCHLSAAAGSLHREPCADRPDVELRFGTDPGGEPVVAALAFWGTAHEEVAAAKAFLAAELGEVRLSPVGPVRWGEEGGRLVAEWPAAGGETGACAAVGPGVCEYVAWADGQPLTARVVFEPGAGWSRGAAAAWVERHTAAARAARTMELAAAELAGV